jgi:UDP-N-acetylmuramate: L-alanyl-gamma-D-glutamyl-meso-diaminopimelate ligase
MGNRIPPTVKTIHLIAVCGTAMGALACMLKDLGYTVTGSDANVYPPMSTFLENKGIMVEAGFDGARLRARPDLVIVGNAVRKDNPEAVAMTDLGLDYCSMPQALNHFVAAGRKAFVVTGTHGKTTTSSMLAWIFQSAGFDPSFMIGGILGNFNSNYRLGKGGIVVLEGDEYDTAFFDKGAKFYHFHPHVAVLTSVEFDHADIFTDLENVKRVFGRFVSGMDEDQALIAFDAAPNIDALVAGAQCRLIRYGEKKNSDWRIGDVSIDPPWNGFEVLRGQKPYGRFRMRQPGAHNRFNALAAIAAADQAAVPVQAIAEALESFAGIRRRQEVRGMARGVTVMDDFAHHPTAVRETISAVRPFYPDGRLIAVFEPRTNTSMRNVFQDAYAESFDLADLICIRQPPLLSKVPENIRFSSEKLVADLKQRGKNALYFPDTDAIISWLVEQNRPDDLVLIMSNGGFDNIHERLLKRLGETELPAGSKENTVAGGIDVSN